jgi:hypothetical protein
VIPLIGEEYINEELMQDIIKFGEINEFKNISQVKKPIKSNNLRENFVNAQNYD